MAPRCGPVVVVDVVSVSIQQEGLDDGPDFLSEEDRGVSSPPPPPSSSSSRLLSLLLINNLHLLNTDVLCSGHGEAWCRWRWVRVVDTPVWELVSLASSLVSLGKLTLLSAGGCVDQRQHICQTDRREVNTQAGEEEMG